MSTELAKQGPTFVTELDTWVLHDHEAFASVVPDSYVELGEVNGDWDQPVADLEESAPISFSFVVIMSVVAFAFALVFTFRPLLQLYFHGSFLFFYLERLFVVVLVAYTWLFFWLGLIEEFAGAIEDLFSSAFEVLYC